ncbi:MAG: hypothetical protein NVSMB1_00130 [Polyangiales bacterium]
MTTRSHLSWLILAPILIAVPSIAKAQGAPTPSPAGAADPADPQSPTSPAQPLGGGSDVAPTSPPSPAPNGAKTAAVELTSLKVMLAKKLISQDEYDAALRDLGETSGMKAGEGNTFVMGRWATTLYGFVEGDAIYDSTQSLNEIAGNSPIAKSGTFGGDHDRAQFSVRNTRLGVRLKAPEVGGVRGSGQLEMDFFGTQLPFAGTNAQLEAANFNNPVLRVRHANMKIETPVIDILIGQYWSLYGWQAMYLPATVEVQGIPGEIFNRQTQIRLSKTVKTDDVTFEIAAAAMKPPQRDSGLPAGQGGIRFAVNKWTAPQTLNLTGSSIQPLSIAITGEVRSLRLPELSATPKETNTKMGNSFAIDAFIPVIPGAKESKGNSLALNGEFSTTKGGGDLYTGLTGSVSNPPLPAPATGGYDPHIDNGLAVYDANKQLQLVQWTAFVVGLQYYFPGSGNLFMSANYAHTQSNNTINLGNPAGTRKSEDWFDVNLFWDVTPAVRLAAEYARFVDTYNDDTKATNHRGQFSGVFLF